MLDFIRFDDDFVLAKMYPPKLVRGVGLNESGVRSKYNVTVVGVKSPGRPFRYAEGRTVVKPRLIMCRARKSDIERFASLDPEPSARSDVDVQGQLDLVVDAEALGILQCFSSPAPVLRSRGPGRGPGWSADRDGCGDHPPPVVTTVATSAIIAASAAGPRRNGTARGRASTRSSGVNRRRMVSCPRPVLSPGEGCFGGGGEGVVETSALQDGDGALGGALRAGHAAAELGGSTSADAMSAVAPMKVCSASRRA